MEVQDTYDVTPYRVFMISSINGTYALPNLSVLQLLHLGLILLYPLNGNNDVSRQNKYCIFRLVIYVAVT